jgi:hypothetical protein
MFKFLNSSLLSSPGPLRRADYRNFRQIADDLRDPSSHMRDPNLYWPRGFFDGPWRYCHCLAVETVDDSNIIRRVDLYGSAQTGPDFHGWPIAPRVSHGMATIARAHKAWDPISAAIREVEFSFPTQAELAEVGTDNIGQLTAHMVEAGDLAEADVEDLKKEVQAIVEDAGQFALQSPQPTMEAAWAHMNCNRHHEILI